MREKALVWTCIITTLIASLAMVKPASAATTTVYLSPVVSTGMPGDTFSVDVMISDVFDLYGYEFMLVYDTNVLTATDLAPHMGTSNEPGFFFPTYTVWYYAMDDDPWGTGEGYAWLSVTLPLGTPQGLSGSGKLATVQFSVDAAGQGYLLNLPMVLLGDPTGPITDFVVYGGYFSSTTPVTFGANLVGKSAWPEHHHFVALKDEDGLQTLYAKVRNTGTVPTRVKVVFEIYDENGFLVATLETPTVVLNADLTITQTVDWGGYTIGMKYSVEARAWYDGIGNGATQTPGIKIKPFSFAVV